MRGVLEQARAGKPCLALVEGDAGLANRACSKS